MFEPRVALASLSGESDADWARIGAEYAGCAFLGGIAIDEATRDAARRMVDRDRNEFLPDDPLAFVESQFRTLADVPIRPAINVRTTTLGPLEAVADLCRANDAVLEVNAHCRQEEMCATGAGESLLQAPDRLTAQVEAAAATGTDVSVKVRTEVDRVDLPALSQQLERAGAVALHVDAMDSEPVVGEVVDATDCFVIANNGVRGGATVREYLAYGADAVSVGRPSTDRTVLRAVQEATEAHFTEATP